MDHFSRINAASGWLELGLPKDALLELALLPKIIQHQPAALELRLEAEIACGLWNQASETARALCLKKPSEGRFFLHAAYCLHQTGDTHQAYQWLLRGPRKLFGDATFHYNLACYLNVLGRRSRARSHLEKALKLDHSLQKEAISDEDLAGVI